MRRMRQIGLLLVVVGLVGVGTPAETGRSAAAPGAATAPPLTPAAPARSPGEKDGVRGDNPWVAALLALRAATLAGPDQAARAAALRQQTREAYPVVWDWLLQDAGPDFVQSWAKSQGTEWERRLLTNALAELHDAAAPFCQDLDGLCRSNAGPEDGRWLALYFRVCEQRRATRLGTLRAQAPRIVFTKRRTIRPSFFAYTEGQSDAQHERHFLPGAELCLWELKADELYGQVRSLLADPTGVIRDPAASWDGQRVVFAWKKSLDQDDYHLYELDVASGRVRQITFGSGVADYEPAWLPNGDLIFASTRCVQTVDCWWTEVSNLYTCDPDGRFLRRLTFDQVHSIFPTVLDDGRVIYTRWDYNDRGQIFPQGLFQMNPDGTGQTEFYGNNSWFPTTIIHARGIPGTPKVLAVLCGHHTAQAGKLAIIDPARGRHENLGVQLVSPGRPTRAERIDAYGQERELWQYPYPLNEREWLVTYAPFGWTGPEGKRHRNDAEFAIYWMDMDGRRELLASDPCLPCQHPVPLMPRTRPQPRPGLVDYRKSHGSYYVQDVYAGPGLAGVRRGTIKKLRVVALEFRVAGVGNNGSSGPGGAALISTPIAIGNGSWDVKVVLGEARVHEDGSAYFTVPARTPVYFQAIDERGHAAQTMRSWSTLQPGEVQSCVGCHEHKNSAPPTAGSRPTLALRAGPQPLEPFYGPARGFSFLKEIQPILDRHCVRCHHDRSRRMEAQRLESLAVNQPDPVWTVSNLAPGQADRARRGQSPDPGKVQPPEHWATNPPAFNLLATPTLDPVAKRYWADSYLNLTLARPANNDWDRGAFAGTIDGRMVNWIGSQSIPAPLPPYAAGACRSELLPLLESGHGGVRLTREELDKLACWIDLLVPYCGDYLEANAWTQEELAKYQRFAAKRQRLEEEERRNIKDFIAVRTQSLPRQASLQSGASE